MGKPWAVIPMSNCHLGNQQPQPLSPLQIWCSAGQAYSSGQGDPGCSAGRTTPNKDCQAQGTGRRSHVPAGRLPPQAEMLCQMQINDTDTGGEHERWATPDSDKDVPPVTACSALYCTCGQYQPHHKLV